MANITQLHHKADWALNCQSASDVLKVAAAVRARREKLYVVNKPAVDFRNKQDSLRKRLEADRREAQARKEDERRRRAERERCKDIAQGATTNQCPLERSMMALDRIINAVALHSAVGSDILRGPSRAEVACTYRSIAMALCRLLTSKSLQQIGDHFDHRDPSTICTNMKGMREVIVKVCRAAPVDATIDDYARIAVGLVKQKMLDGSVPRTAVESNFVFEQRVLAETTKQQELSPIT